MPDLDSLYGKRMDLDAEEGYVDITAREYFLSWIKAELSTPHERKAPAITERWLTELRTFLEAK